MAEVKRFRTEPIRFGKRASYREPIRFGKRHWQGFQPSFDLHDFSNDKKFN